jgi:phage shock protein C
MTNQTASHKDDTMTNQTPLPLRHDNILGVCEAIGQDFGFNPIYLRLAFIAPIFFAPAAAIGSYLALGLVVTATRWLAPDQTAPQPAVEQEAESQEFAIAA